MDRINTSQEGENSFDRLLNDGEIGDLIKLDITENDENVCEHLYNAEKSQFFYYCHLAAEQLVSDELFEVDFTDKYDSKKSVETFTYQNPRDLVVKCTEPLRKCNCSTYKRFG